MEGIMRRYRLLSAPIIATMVVVSVALVPSCRRAPEEPVLTPTIVVPPTPTPRVRLTTLAPPQQNAEIGITVTTLPPGLVITHNDESWIEVTDGSRINVQYTFLALSSGDMKTSPSEVDGFEALIPPFDGNALSEGEIDTVFGAARWASGTYLEDDEVLVDVRIFAAHPSGNGLLVIYSACRENEATVDERLAVMQELLTHVS